MSKRFSQGFAAILATTVIACGSVNGGAHGARSPERAGGDAFLTSDQTYGVQQGVHTEGAQGALSNPVGGPELQP